MKEVVIITLLMVVFVIVGKELRKPHVTDPVFTDEEIEAWQPFD